MSETATLPAPQTAPNALNAGAGGVVEAVEALVGTLPRPTWDEYFAAAAVLIGSRSSCERLHVGCVVVSAGRNANRIIAAGYNGFLPGAPHESHVRDGHEQATVHAEQNAIADAAKRGAALEGATVYVTHFPCVNCAKILAAAGVGAVKYLHDYRNDPLVPVLLAQAGVRVEQIRPAGATTGASAGGAAPPPTPAPPCT
ncbi:MAG: dCMP deaminase [Puniceicoccales bacterium]|jgi:dCMP deaminase|nr:dCMP deaminase [Puniceicoccales bacterium]